MYISFETDDAATGIALIGSHLPVEGSARITWHKTKSGYYLVTLTDDVNEPAEEAPTS